MTLTSSAKPIPSTGERIPVIGLGTWRAFDVGKSASARASLEQCLSLFDSLGGGMIDTSPMYGHAEEVLGDLAPRWNSNARVPGYESLDVGPRNWNRSDARVAEKTSC